MFSKRYKRLPVPGSIRKGGVRTWIFDTVSCLTCFQRSRIHVLSRPKSAYRTERKRWELEETRQQMSVTNLKILDSFRNQNQTTQNRETKSTKCLLWCNDKNIWILQQQSPSAISMKKNSIKVFILEIKKHPSELFISFCDLRGDGMAQHSLL